MRRRTWACVLGGVKYERADVRPTRHSADKFVVAILPLGYPAETPGSARGKLDEIVMFGGNGRKGLESIKRDSSHLLRMTRSIVILRSRRRRRISILQAETKRDPRVARDDKQEPSHSLGMTSKGEILRLPPNTGHRFMPAISLFRTFPGICTLAPNAAAFCCRISRCT